MEKTDHRKVYAKGFYDGIASIGGKMNPARVETVVNGLSGISRKVYGAIPINESWTPAQISVEMKRLNIPADHKVIMGCINYLMSKGLIKHHEGAYKRKEKQLIKVPPASLKLVKDDTEVKTIKNGNEIMSKSPIDVLGTIADQIDVLKGGLEKLKIDIENAAITIDEQFSDSERKSEKLAQLQALLKGLS